MHEAHLMKDLMQKILQIGEEQQAKEIVSIQVKLGALSHFTPEHFKEHFIEASAGTMAEGAKVHTILMTDIEDPQAQGVILESVEVSSPS